MTESEFIPRPPESGDTHPEPGRGLVRAEEVLPDTLQLIPLSFRPYFPVLVQPIVVDKKPWGDGIRKVAESSNKLLALSFVKTAKPNSEGGIPAPDQIARVGCVVRIHRLQEVEDKFQFIAQGLQRFRIREWVRREPPYIVRVEYFNQESVDDSQTRAYAMAIIDIIKELMTLNPLYNEELKQYLNYFNPNDPGPLTDFAAAITSAEPAQMQEILETIPLLERMEKVLMMITRELEVAKLQAEITQQIQEQVSGQQREFFLKEQLKSIQKELGIAKDDRQADVEKFSARLASLTVPELTQQRVDEELQKLNVLETSSAEYSVTRNYLDWVTQVPWGKHSKDQLDLKAARKVLDRDHDGLGDVKDRIIEFLAVGAYRGEVSGSILLLVGPPGVGKTSIGKSIASALGRAFYRFSLGGMRDEAEIKGHRRTYIGAMPGKMIQALKQVKVANPVIMLDEIDKIGASYQGDPASALLEVLDPEQNAQFLDHYLDLPVDLSNVLFICTANQLDTIPGPLLDRMETIRLAGYLTDEKVDIAMHHLWRKHLARAGIPRKRLKIGKTALRQVVEGYAREAGVRTLDKELGRIVRKSTLKLLEDKDANISIGAADIPDLLGAPVFNRQKSQRGVGVVNGLAWTALGGTTLAVEAGRVHENNRGLKLTGKLGDVMKESAEIAYSMIVANAEQLGADASYFDTATVHLHVPEGATPKDGPSAGITMATALLSLARNKPVKRNLAMTGELTLTGRVLPVGGIREKVIAARRAGLKELIMPADNQRDFDEMPANLKKGLKVHFASSFAEVAKICFGASNGI